MYDKTKKVTEEEAEGEKDDEEMKTQVKVYASQDGFEEKKETAQEDDQ